VSLAKRHVVGKGTVHLSTRLLNGGFNLAESCEASLLNTLSSTVMCDEFVHSHTPDIG